MPFTPQAPTPPVPATTPQAPGIPTPAPVAGAPQPSFAFKIPQTAQEVANLRARRQELSNQIENVMSRRRSLARLYENANGSVDRSGLAQQLGVLDQRVAQMEADLA